MINPSYQSGFYAPDRGGTPKYPSLWRGCVGAWNPSLGQSGLVLRDWSGNKNHGTLTNGPTWVPSDGKTALSFDGTDDYITIGNQSVFNFGTGSFTLSLWIKTTGSTRRSILNKFRYDGIATNEQGFYVDVISTGHIRTSIETLGVTVNYRARDSSVTINNGAWRHVAVVRNGINVFPDVYVDGVLRNAGTFSNGTVASISSTVEFEIAREWDEQSQGQTGHFIGSVDDLVVYGIALDATNIGYLAAQRGAIYELAPRKVYSLPAAASTYKPYLQNYRSQIIGGGLK